MTTQNLGSFTQLNALQVAGIVFLAFTLIPAGAHFFELPNKMRLSLEDYMTVQQIYRGWAFFGVAIYGALLLTLVHTVLVRSSGATFTWSLLAFLCLAATQVIFWAFTYPANVLTAQWTISPPDLEAVRRQWEYSHAVNAVLSFLALISFSVSAILSHSAASPP